MVIKNNTIFSSRIAEHGHATNFWFRFRLKALFVQKQKNRFWRAVRVGALSNHSNFVK